MSGHSRETPAGHRGNSLTQMVDRETFQRAPTHIAAQRAGDHAGTAWTAGPRTRDHEAPQRGSADGGTVDRADAEHVLEKRTHVADARHARGVRRAAHIAEIAFVLLDFRVDGR